jgi:hypothetical protein
MAIRGKQKSLKDVAKVYKDKALNAINPGVPYKQYKTGSSKAYKTGNLFSNVASENRISNIFKKDKRTGKVIFTFNIAPRGAQYGKYVQNGTYKMKKRPFAEIAAESPEFKKALDDYINTTVVAGKLDAFFLNIDKQMKDVGVQVDSTL